MKCVRIVRMDIGDTYAHSIYGKQFELWGVILFHVVLWLSSVHCSQEKIELLKWKSTYTQAHG